MSASWAITWSVRLLYWLQLRCICSIRWRTNLCCFPSSCSYPRNKRNLISLCCWLISPHFLHIRFPNNQAHHFRNPKLFCAQLLIARLPFFFFFSCFSFFNGGSLAWQNLANHRCARAESPCTWAGIQEDRVLVVNQHPNNVSQFIRGWTVPIRKLLNAAFVVKYLNQQWIFPTFYYSSLIPNEEFISHLFSFPRALPSVAAVVCLFFHFFNIFDGCCFVFFSLLFRFKRLMIKDSYSSPATFQTNGAYLTIMQNITAYIKYFVNCHRRFISLFIYFADSWMLSHRLDSLHPYAL